MQTLDMRKQGHLNAAHNPTNIGYNRPFMCALRDTSNLFKWYVIEEIEGNSQNVVNELKKLERYYINKFRTYIGFSDSKGYNATLGGDGVSVLGDSVYRINSMDYTVKEKYRSRKDVLKVFNTVVSVTSCCNTLINTAYGDVWYYKKDYDSMTKENLIKDVDYRVNKIYYIDNEKRIINKFNNILELLQFFNFDFPFIFQKQNNGICFAKDYYNNQYNKGLYFIEKIIVQYDLDGNYLNYFESFYDAERVSGVKRPSIKSVCEKEKITAGNYQWRYAYDTLDVGVVKAGRDNVIHQVSQYDLEGNYISTFESLSNAAIVLGIDSSTISKVCKGKKQTCKGWRFAYGNSKQKLKPLKIYEGNQKKQVYYQNNLGQEFVFESISEAGRKTGVNKEQISRWCKSGKRTQRNEYWCFL